MLFSYKMDYDAFEVAVTENTKAIIPVDLGGIPCDYDCVFEIVKTFKPANEMQTRLGRIAVVADAAHAFGAEWHGQMVGSIADFTNFSLVGVKNFADKSVNRYGCGDKILTGVFNAHTYGK